MDSKSGFGTLFVWVALGKTCKITETQLPYLWNGDKDDLLCLVVLQILGNVK